jgi:outer membrane protein assembly factor BamB
MKELIYSVEEDKKRIFISYNTDRIKNIGDMPDTRNIWCFDKKTGERLWVIEQEKGNNPRVFNAASFHEDWILRVSTTQGLTYDLDPETGKISNPVFTK